MFSHLKTVWNLSWPLIVANSFWNIQLTIDRMLLGEYSTESLAATLSVMGLFWAPMALVQQTAAYVTTFVAQYLGAQQQERIAGAVWQGVYVSFVGGVMFLFLIPWCPWIFAMVDHSPTIQSLEVQYFQSLTWSALPTALVAVCSGFYTGLGRSKIVIAINGVGMVANLLFDYILIFGHFGFPELGIVGAGLATSIGGYLAAIFGFYFVLFGSLGRSFKLARGWRFDLRLFKSFLKYGVPSGLQWALEGLAFTLFLVFIGRLPNGDVALASSSIAVTIMMMAVLPNIGLGQGVSALVGQYMGRNDPNGAVQVAWSGLTLSLSYISVMAISFVWFADSYTFLFKSSDVTALWGEVESVTPKLLLFIAVFVIFDAVNFIMSFVLKGAGDTLFVSVVALLVPWPLMVFPTWWVSDRMDGLYWAWTAATLFVFVQATCFSVRFLQGRWKGMRVIETYGTTNS